MDNPELILQNLEHFPKLKEEDDFSIPVELEEYIHYVAKTGDPVFQWTLVKPLFREKLIKVITDFFESNPGDIPDYPNVAKFSYDAMKETLLERFDWFKGAPFTIQRISELLVNPTKEYNRVDKYMRALEKNIYVVSTREPGMPQQPEENNSSFEESFIMNGNDFELKTDNNEDNVSKDEEENNALLMLKKCSNGGDTDDPSFNIEVDVTNTTPEDAIEDIKLASTVDIIVHDQIPISVECANEAKCGQTRKLEDGDNNDEESESKRFKMDDELEMNQGKPNEESETSVSDDNVNVDTTPNSEELPINEQESERNDEKSSTENSEEESPSLDKGKLDEDVTNVINEDDAKNNIEPVSEIVVEDQPTKVTESQDSSDANHKNEEEDNITDDKKDIEEDNTVSEDLTPKDSESNEETVVEATLPQSDDMNIEPTQEKHTAPDEESNRTEETKEEPELEDQMELEETVDNKIVSFDNNKSESSLDVSEGDSMVISQESASSSEENADKSIEKVEMTVSESSDMDLSDGADPK